MDIYYCFEEQEQYILTKAEWMSEIPLEYRAGIKAGPDLSAEVALLCLW